ncbi:MAG: hypothetical protein K9I85_03775 [Saprospiraceae bacterium]|nr:hypothetical protein [Saprospiraceae bacterium]
MWYWRCILAVCLFSSCVGQRQIYPLVESESAVGIQAGGPLIQLGDAILPIPFSALYAARGLAHGWMADLGIHTSALLYKTIYLDPGAQKTFAFPSGIRPGLNTGIRLNTMTDLSLQRWRFYPQADLHLWWADTPNRHLGYIGMSHWFDPHREQARERSTYKLWRPAVYIGYQYRRNDWDFSLESKWLAPGTDNRFNAIEYQAPAHQGALGFYLTVQYRFL